MKYWCKECNGNRCLIECKDLHNTDENFQFNDNGCEMIKGGFTKRPLWIPESTNNLGLDKNYSLAIVRTTKSKPLRKKKYARDDEL